MASQLYHDVFIGVGSNMGRRIRYLEQAVQMLRTLGPCVCSPVYETKPVGVLEQPDFLNMVVQLHTQLAPLQLLSILHSFEQEANRTRGIRFGPRTLDLDILLFDDIYYLVSGLQIPHPRMWSRAFALAPLADLVPGRRGLGGQRMIELAERSKLKDEVRYVGRFW